VESLSKSQFLFSNFTSLQRGRGGATVHGVGVGPILVATQEEEKRGVQRNNEGCRFLFHSLLY
jgi:hypothetical protein